MRLKLGDAVPCGLFRERAECAGKLRADIDRSEGRQSNERGGSAHGHAPGGLAKCLEMVLDGPAVSGLEFGSNALDERGEGVAAVVGLPRVQPRDGKSVVLEMLCPEPEEGGLSRAERAVD